jgi:glutamate synthase domain-containing protein 2
MKPVLTFISLVVALGIVFFLLVFQPWPMFIGILVFLAIVGIYDVTQTKRTILRNFPILGHLRFILEGIGPEIRQYFIESDTEGKPLNRTQRTYIYSRAKLENDKHPFGTELDLSIEGNEWVQHSIYPSHHLDEAPRVLIGGEKCTQPYSAALFNISAMSYGSLSKNAIMALNKGAKTGGFYHNTGEGSISPYHRMGGDLVYQIGTGYFGCRAKDGGFDREKFKVTANYPEVKMIELKISQGAKPGHGGILPGAKNTPEIAAIRGVEPYTTVDSPPGHRAFSDAEGLLTFIDEMRELANGKPVGFKICIGNTREFEEICETMVKTGRKPDFITIDGAEGGTGAAPIIFSDHVGMPLENALTFAIDTLIKYDLKKDIKVIASAKIVDGFDIFKALSLGADLCNSARGMMLALGCIQALACHKNTCPAGVATNKPSLVRGLVVEEKWKRVKNYQNETIKDFLGLFSAAGCKQLSDLNRTLINKQMNGKPVSFADIYPYPAKN